MANEASAFRVYALPENGKIAYCRNFIIFFNDTLIAIKPMKKTKNSRRHTRLTHRAQVELSNSNETVVGYTKDISDSGVLVLGNFNNLPAIGDTLWIKVLEIEDAASRMVIVRRIDPGKGIAVEFIDPPAP